MTSRSRARFALASRHGGHWGLDRGEREVLEAIAHGAPEPDLLRQIVRLIETRADGGMLCSIVLFDETAAAIRTGAGPSLPPAFLRALDGLKIGPNAGSCGAAMYRREIVIVEDIATHPFWVPYRELALPHGLRACWSTPFFSADGSLLGSFAMYFREPRGPTPRERLWVARATHLASIAVARGRLESTIRSEERRRALAFDSVSDVLFEIAVDPSGDLRFSAINAAFERTTGLVRAAVVGRLVREVIPPPSAELVLERYATALRERRAVSWREEIRFPTGVRYGEVTVSPVFDAESRPVGLVGAVHDITEHVQARASIEAQARLLDFASDAIVCGDLDGTVRYWNGGAERLYGYSRREALGRRVQELIYADIGEFERAWQLLRENDSFSGELSQLRRNQQPIVVDARWTLIRDASGAAEAVLAINSDATPRKELEYALQRSRRLESIGRFAGGIAHDFNNILLAISANTSLVAEARAEDPFVKEALGEVLDATARANELVRQILTFGRQREPKREPVAPSRVVAEALRLVRPVLPDSIALETSLDEAAPAILADASQLHQVTMNLVNNAAQAMPGGGRLSVRVDRARVSAPPSGAPQLSPGEYACLTVTDTGSGMDEATQQRIFDPFFTTKSGQGGTGLGLSVVDGIVKTHGGSVVVTSRPGHGSTFAVYLPAAPLASGELATT